MGQTMAPRPLNTRVPPRPKTIRAWFGPTFRYSLAMTLRMVNVPSTISPTMTQNPAFTGSMGCLLSPALSTSSPRRRRWPCALFRHLIPRARIRDTALVSKHHDLGPLGDLLAGRASRGDRLAGPGLGVDHLARPVPR